MLANALMRSRAIDVHHIHFESSVEVSFAHDEDVVEAFAPDTAEQSFADRVRAWCLDGRSEDLDPGSDCDSLEVWAVLRIVVTIQILGLQQRALLHPEGTRSCCGTHSLVASA